jgi:hypothetical protein
VKKRDQGERMAKMRSIRKILVSIEIEAARIRFSQFYFEGNCSKGVVLLWNIFWSTDNRAEKGRGCSGVGGLELRIGKFYICYKFTVRALTSPKPALLQR